MALLSIEGVSKQFHGLRAVDDVTFSVESAQILGLVGPNGAGKTTLFNLITGFLSISKGRILLKERDITNCPIYERARMGMGRTFQTSQLFSEFTVSENLLVSGYGGLQAVRGLFGGGQGFHAIHKKIEMRVDEIIDFVGLAEYRSTRAGNLSYASQRRVEIGRALMIDPCVLLLDEPAAGMNLTEVQELNQLIRRIQLQGRAIIVVEHNMRVIMDVADKVSVIEFGRLIAEGSPQTIRNDPVVIKAYLGTQESEYVTP